MSKMFKKIKDWYDRKIWKKKHVADAVMKGQLTPEEYELIVGEPYEE